MRRRQSARWVSCFGVSRFVSLGIPFCVLGGVLGGCPVVGLLGGCSVVSVLCHWVGVPLWAVVSLVVSVLCPWVGVPLWRFVSSEVGVPLCRSLCRSRWVSRGARWVSRGAVRWWLSYGGCPVLCGGCPVLCAFCVGVPLWAVLTVGVPLWRSGFPYGGCPVVARSGFGPVGVPWWLLIWRAAPSSS